MDLNIESETSDEDNPRIHEPEKHVPEEPGTNDATPRVLGPVRTGRETPKGSRPSSQILGDVDDKPIKVSSPKPPLPPIGNKDRVSGRVSPANSDGSNDSAKNSKTNSASKARPRIVSYRREMSVEDDVPPPDQRRKSVSFSREGSASKPKKTATFTMETQTEWSWLTDMKRLEQLQERSETPSKIDRRHSSIESGSNAEKELTKLADDGIPDSEDESEASFDPRDGGKTPRSRGVTPGDKSLKEEADKPDEVAPPFNPNDNEYGIPLLELSSDSDTSDDDEDETDEPMPSIGPPQILQYIRESEAQYQDGEDPENRTNIRDAIGTDENIQDIEEDDEAFLRNLTSAGSMFDGMCEFCEQPIKPFPTMEQQDRLPPEELYCCDDYREFVHFTLTHPLHKKYYEDEKIDVKPHPHYGSKAQRREAKERAQVRLRERELKMQQAAAGHLTSGGPGGAAGQGGQNFYANFARQMKTINYQLSSAKCLEEGWTLRAPSPLEEIPDDPEYFETEESPAWETLKQTHREMFIRRNYSNGQPFLTLFPDGTGNVFYSSGRNAITISSIERGQFTYIVHGDREDRPPILATFEPNGNASVYYPDGSIRLVLDQLGGLELDNKGSKKRRWLWKDQHDHVHAPPFQPICIGVASGIGLRVMSQEKIGLTMAEKQRSVRFNVGARIKVLWENLPPNEEDVETIYLRDTKTSVETLLDKVSNLLKYPNSTKVEKLQPPLSLASKIQKNEKTRKKRHHIISETPDPVQDPTLPTVKVN
ncbi:unnamed protein product [Owenia fusiformis]|uniref:Uncharacterized protein n=1 Tax=Owenia fusiformis TaxID=6347 RepID=A0A8J1UGW1_OWEFU|nr:unnamed protein product [Owenia fusiformis]